MLGKANNVSQNLEKSGLKQCKNLGNGMSSMSSAINSMKSGNGGESAKSAQKAADELNKSLSDKQNEFTKKFGDQFFLQGMGQNSRQQYGNEGQGSTLGSVKIPDKSKIEKSREILEELYRRSKDKNLPEPEHDYIDRLLEDF